MRRRVVLVAAGGTLSTLLPGCLGGDQSGDSSPGNSEPSPESDPGTDTGGSAAAAFGDESCPPYESDADRTACSHTADPSSAPVMLDASPVRTTLADGQPGEEITLTFTNRTGSEIGFNPHSWYVWRQTGGEWQELEQEWSGHSKVTVAAGDTHTWSFTEAVAAIQPEPRFEPGRYAAEIHVPEPEGDDEVACVALLELEAAE